MSVPTPGPPVPTSDGITLASWDLGGDGPPLLFLHATGFHGRCWGPLASYLTDSYHCWSIDQRGHGASDRSPDMDYAWRHFSDDVAATVRALGMTRPYVVGHSLGGGVALMSEALQPGTFAAIYAYEPIVVGPALANPMAPPGAGGSNNHLAHLARRRRPRFDSKAAAADNYLRKPPFSLFRADVLAAYVDGGFRDLPDGGVTLCCDTESEARVFEAAAEAGIAELLSASATPTYLACGDQDPVVAKLEAIAEPLGGAGTEVFAYLGHLGPFEDPGRVARAIATAFG